MTRYVTTNDAAAAVNVKPHTIREWAHQGLLRTVGKHGRQQVYDLAEVFAAERDTRVRRRRC